MRYTGDKDTIKGDTLSAKVGSDATVYAVGGASNVSISTSSYGDGNGALYFYGTSNTVGSYVWIPRFKSPANGMSISFWFNMTASSGGWSRIMDFGIGENNHNILIARYASTNSILFEVRIGATVVFSEVIIPANNFSYNQWYHVAITLSNPDTNYDCTLTYYIRPKNSIPTSGLLFKIFNGYFADDVNYDSTATLKSGASTGYTTTISNINTGTGGYIPLDSSTEYYSVFWYGYFKSDFTGTWTFSLYSDDSSLMWIGDNALSGYSLSNLTVDNRGTHAMETRTGTISLVAGTYYPIRIAFGEQAHGDNCVFSWSRNGSAYITDGTGYFFDSKPLSSTVTTVPNKKYPTSIIRTTCYLGKSNWSGDSYYNGYIDDFRIYDGVLSQSEVNNLYSNTTPLSTSNYKLNSSDLLTIFNDRSNNRKNPLINNYLIQNYFELNDNFNLYKFGTKQRTSFLLNGKDIGDYLQYDDDTLYRAIVVAVYNTNTWGVTNSSMSSAVWIWNISGAATTAPGSASDGTPYLWFYYTFYYNKPNNTGTAYGACDNVAYLYFNGINVGTLDGGWPGGITISINIVNGLNYIRAPAYNQGGPAGLIIAFYDSEGNNIANTNGFWSVSQSANYNIPSQALAFSPDLSNLITYSSLPSTISFLQLWFDATDTTTITKDGSNKVSAWKDKSSNAYSVVQPTSGNQPLYQTNLLNGKAGILLSNTSWLYQTGNNMPNFSSSTDTSVFIVARNDSSLPSAGWSIFNTIWFNGNTGGGTTRYHLSFNYGGTLGVELRVNSNVAGGHGATVPYGANSVVGFTISISSSVVSVNGTPVYNTGYSLASANNASTQFVFGDPRQQNLVKDIVIYEMLGFNKQLSTGEREQVEGYLASKWGLQANLPTTHPYYSSFPGFMEDSSPITTPLALSGSLLWLDSNDATTFTYSSGSFVSQWNDKSGSNYHFTQSVTGRYPVRTTVSNGKPGVSFTDFNYILSNTTLPFPTNYSVFIVGYTSATGGSALIAPDADSSTFYFGIGTGTNLLTRVGTGPSWNSSTTNTPETSVSSLCIMGLTNNNTTTGLLSYVNGRALDARNGMTVSCTGMRLGAGSVQYQSWGGYICEVLIYNRVLSNSERIRVENYLGTKWGIQVSV
jgi:hypothetical protein